MNRGRFRQNGDRVGLGSICEDGNDDSETSFEIEQQSSLLSSLSTLQYSRPQSTLPSASLSPPISDLDHDLLFSCSIKRRKDCLEQKYCRRCSKIVLFTVAVTTLIAVADMTAKSSSNNLISLFRDNFDNHRSSSLFHAQNWFQSQRRRFLEDEMDSGSVNDGFDFNDDNFFIDDDDIELNSDIESGNATNYESDDSLNYLGSNQTEAPDTDTSDDGLSTIEVTLPAGVTAEDEDIADVIDSLITPSPTPEPCKIAVDETISAGGDEPNSPADAPISPSSPTLLPAIFEPGSPIPSSLDPSPAPSVSFEPSPVPTRSPRPTITITPTESSAPSFDPTNSPSTSPTLEPSDTFEPSASPSNSPTISPEPSPFPSYSPTEEPSISPYPSAGPTQSAEPTTSFYPSRSPSDPPTFPPTGAPTPAATEIVTKTSIKMILTNVPSKLQNGTEGIWEDVTSKHVKKHVENFYLKLYPNQTSNETFFEIKVDIEFINQKVIKREETDSDEIDPISGQVQAVYKPPIIPDESPNTLKIEIEYDQTVSYESDEVNMTEEELLNRFFVLPFTTDSFHYSMDLYESGLNWTTWVHVDTVDPIGPATLLPEMPPTRVASKLTSAQTFAISASTIIAACLIVFTLLWERKQKGAFNARVEESSSINSAMQAMQGTPVQDWNQMYFPTNEDIPSNETAYASARSAPGHLRRDSLERGIVRPKEAFEGRRGKESSKDNGPNPSNGKFGTTKSSSSNSSILEYNQEMSPKLSPKEEAYGSPGIPQQDDRPYLPPLPPPSLFGSNKTPERARTVDSLFAGVGAAIRPKDYNNNTKNVSSGRAPSGAFRRPSGRAFGMRVSGINNDDMSVLTDPFSSDSNRFSGDLVIPNPQFDGPKYVTIFLND